MKKNDFNIDDLFAEARKEPPVISKDEVRGIINGSSQPAGSFQFKKFFKGEKKMFSIIGATAAAISIIFMNVMNFDNHNGNIDSKKVNSSNSIAMNTQKSEPVNSSKTIAANTKKTGDNSTDKTTGKKILPPKDDNNFSVSQDKNYKLAEEHNKPYVKNIDSDIKGIKSIKLDGSELKDLGISVDNSGQFIEVFMSKRKARPTKIFVDWGIGYNSDINPSELPENYIIPRMITDNRGMRRIEIFSDENTDISIDQSDNGELGNMKLLIENFINETKDSDAGDLFWANKEKWADSTFNFETMFSNMAEIMETDSTLKKHSGLNSDSVKKIMVMFNSLDKKEKKEITDEISELKEQMKNIRIDIKNIRKDSINIKREVNVNKMVTVITNDKSDNNDSEDKLNVHVLVDKREQNPDGTIKDEKNIQITFNDNKTKPIEFQMPEININKLLPVEVSVPNAVDKKGNKLDNFSFILWLDLDKETYKHLPLRIRDQVKPEYDALAKTDGAVCGFSPNDNGENYLDIWRTCAGAIENVSASPNPTPGNVNLSFLLKENRNVTISINDVFGKKVADIITNKRMNKGENFESFNLPDVEAGMYLIVVQTNAGEQAVHRVIKN